MRHRNEGNFVIVFSAVTQAVSWYILSII